MISEPHRAFARAVVAAAKANGFSMVTMRFGDKITEQTAASWEATQFGGKIRLSVEQAEAIDPEGETHEGGGSRHE